MPYPFSLCRKDWSTIMRTLSTMPLIRRKVRRGLTLPQIRVMRVLYRARGPLTRTKISERCGNRTTIVVGRAVGYSDPVKRRAFEQTRDGGGSPGNPCKSLLTLGYVREKELDIDGYAEIVIELTAAGRRVYERLPKVERHRAGEPLRTHYN